MKRIVDWPRIWDDDGKQRDAIFLKFITRILSFFYCIIVLFRNRLYDRNILNEIRLSCPVISVGNLTVGGTGKTPCVIMLAQMLRENGFRPAVISRGYKAQGVKSVNIVSDGHAILLPEEIAGDEPWLMAKFLGGIPVITGPQRVLTGSVAVEKFGADVLICDDAMQHRRIFRDINLVLMDPNTLKPGNRVLPRGRLREPVSGIKRASAVLLTRVDENVMMDNKIARLIETENIPVFKSIHRAIAVVSADGTQDNPLSALEGKNICAFCGIANPAAFRKTLYDAGANILSFDIFPDHHAFSGEELEALKRKYIEKNADYLVTTEKDTVRLQKTGLLEGMLYFVRIEMEIVPSPETFKEFILKKLLSAQQQIAGMDVR